MAPLRLLRRLLCLDDEERSLTGAAARAQGCPAAGRLPALRARHRALFAATGFAHHPYAPLRHPGRPAPNDEWVSVVELPRLSRLLDVAWRRAGLARGPDLWITEFGYQTNPPDPTGLPLAQQAEWINEAEHLAFVNPRVRSWAQFLLADDPPFAGGRPERWAGFQTGLTTVAGVAKPALDAFRLPLTVSEPLTADRAASVWGLVRPAPASVAAIAALEFRAPGSGWQRLRSVTAVGPRHVVRTHVRFGRCGQLRLTWNGHASRAARVGPC